MAWVTPLWIGRPVRGVVIANSELGLIVDFQRNRALLPTAELRPGDVYGMLDEIEAWVLELEPELGQVWLTRRPPPEPVDPDSVLQIGPRVRRREPRKIREGEGVPFWELYMQRRSKKSWG